MTVGSARLTALTLGIAWTVLSMVPVLKAGPVYNSVVASQNCPREYNHWPADSVRPATSKVDCTVGYRGNVYRFLFPSGSGNELLYTAAPWVGAIRGTDTLVSTCLAWELKRSGTTMTLSETVPAGYPAVERNMMPIGGPRFSSFRGQITDSVTWTHADHVTTSYDYFRGEHRSMDLRITLKTHTLNEYPYRNIVLLDYTLTNTGDQVLRDAYAACYGMSWVTDSAHAGVNGDDVVGSLKDIATVYAIDNDGQFRGFQQTLLTPDAICVKAVYSSRPVTDTNFNWWNWTGWSNEVDFGPRQKDHYPDPFRDFRTGTIGFPVGDVNRYYVMAHDEWDYDQIRVAQIGADDPVWMEPQGIDDENIAKGYNPNFLLSLGSTRLYPDSSWRVIFALFGADLVHTDVNNRLRLLKGEYNAFYNGLNFELVRRSAEAAEQMTEELLNPRRPPTGFKLKRMSHDSAWFTWDDGCLPEITGYRLYVRPVPSRYLINPMVVSPEAVNMTMTDAAPRSFPAKAHEGIITDLEPGRPYLAALARVGSSGESAPCDPIVIGTKNQVLTPEPPIFTRTYWPFYEDDEQVSFSWEPSPDSLTRYYKIYKIPDSLTALNPYRPFWSDDSSLVPFKHAGRYATASETAWYYEMAAYDSISSRQTSYRDPSPVSGAFYRVTAVSQAGFESAFSDHIVTELDLQPARDILLVLGSPLALNDYIEEPAVWEHLTGAMGKRVFETFNWTDTNYLQGDCPDYYCANWRDFLDYDLIIVQEYPQPKLLPAATDSSHPLLQRLIDLGRDVAYFGFPPGSRQILLSTSDTVIEYDSNSFEHRYLGLDSSVLRSWEGYYDVFGVKDTLGGFTGASPAGQDWPDLPVANLHAKIKGVIERLFDIDSTLPMTPAFYPRQDTEAIYHYRSAFPSSSHLKGLPCGVVTRHQASNVYAFSFPLWAIDQEQARALVDRLARDADGKADPQPSAETPLPERFVLRPNYPNPFNAGTSISFELPHSATVTLDIFNVLGARVRTLLNSRPLPPGPHVYEWNGKNAGGDPVASGTYFYRLTVDGTSQSRKMTLLK